MSISSSDIKEYFGSRRQLQAFFYQRGPVGVYRSISKDNEDELLFVISTEDEEKAVAALRKRASMRGQHIARLNEAGLFKSGGGYWVCRLELASRFDEILIESTHNPLRVLRLVYQLALGLSDIHKTGRYHGDVRSSNIWARINSDGKEEAFLVGMALDYWMGQGDIDSLDVETAMFLAPERVMGEAPSQSTDIYAIGVLLYRGLFGMFPFKGDDTYSVTAAQATEAVKKPELSFPLDEPVWNLIQACLTKDPSNRLGSIEQLVKQLSPYLSFEQQVFHRPPPEPLIAPSPEPSIQDLHKQYQQQVTENPRQEDHLSEGTAQPEELIPEDTTPEITLIAAELPEQLAQHEDPKEVTQVQAEVVADDSDDESIEWEDRTEEEVTIVPVKVKVQMQKKQSLLPKQELSPTVYHHGPSDLAEELPEFDTPRPTTEIGANVQEVDIQPPSLRSDVSPPEEVTEKLISLPKEHPDAQSFRKTRSSTYKIDLDVLQPKQQWREEESIDQPLEESVSVTVSIGDFVDSKRMVILFLVGFIGMLFLLWMVESIS